ncbi:hypothetical protein GFD17_00605 [Bifidobacterium sp. SMB2]|uniref:Uncharacterized protein n=1 Tax=Bifidobacterium saimiriisciurei TaxID=2661627 RepID=A0ABX0CAX6_9BIFI|nr:MULTISPECIES: hypothetical protein [Bifidobacterium]NEG95282.1 hypothetical protein [Bifidobacterium sp. SMB2]NEH11359.1 hypothetical protein [Bifidobacterium saimiriisciurei]
MSDMNLQHQDDDRNSAAAREQDAKQAAASSSQHSSFPADASADDVSMPENVGNSPFDKLYRPPSLDDIVLGAASPDDSGESGSKARSTGELSLFDLAGVRGDKTNRPAGRRDDVSVSAPASVSAADDVASDASKSAGATATDPDAVSHDVDSHADVPSVSPEFEATADFPSVYDSSVFAVPATSGGDRPYDGGAAPAANADAAAAESDGSDKDLEDDTINRDDVEQHRGLFAFAFGGRRRRRHGRDAETPDDAQPSAETQTAGVAGTQSNVAPETNIAPGSNAADETNGAPESSNADAEATTVFKPSDVADLATMAIAPVTGPEPESTAALAGGDTDDDASSAEDATPAPKLSDEELAQIAKQRHAKRKKILRGIVTPILAVLAIASFVFGALNMTIWKPNPHVAVSAKTTTQYVVSDPGVLALADNTVDITVKGAADAQVCVAVAAPRDATGWLSGQQYTRISGLETWQKFSTQQTKIDADDSGSGSSSAASSSDGQGDGQSVAFQDSDMWESVQCDQGSATLKWKEAGSDRVVLVDANAGSTGANAAADATVTMSWTRAQVPDFATPFYFVGGLLVAMAVLVATIFSIEDHRRRKKQAESPVEPEPEPEPGEHPHWMHGRSESSSRRRGERRHSHRRSRRRRNHEAELAAAAVENVAAAGETASGPAILDVTSVNMLEQQAPDSDAASGPGIEFATGETDAHGVDAVEPNGADAGGSGDDTEVGTSTSQITADELQDYFARLAAENAANQAAANAVEESSEANDSSADGSADENTDETDETTKEGK